MLSLRADMGSAELNGPLALSPKTSWPKSRALERRQADAIATDPAVALLISLAGGGDQVAFAALYKQTHAKLFAVISRVLSRSELARDVLQETYIRIWQNAGGFNEEKGSPIAWMATIARNRALDEVCRIKRQRLEVLPDDFELADEFDSLGVRRRIERLRATMRCLSGLDREKRQLILLAYYRGASREALSKRFDCPVGTIKVRLRRTLSLVKGSVSVEEP